MTYAVVPALRHAPGAGRAVRAAARRPAATTRVCAPPETKEGLLAGMAMTEKQGGSDVRANTTRAEPAPGAGPGAHLLTGHKWFCSAPMCDLFLTLAQAPGGPDLLPAPPGAARTASVTACASQRLKDKLGNRSNASAEIELDAALAWQVGEAGPGRRHDHRDGQRDQARLRGGQRRGHAPGDGRRGAPRQPPPGVRQGPGRASADGLRAGRSGTGIAGGDRARAPAGRGRRPRRPRRRGARRALLRVALPAAKYWVCKRTPAHAAEALECLGGNGYVEESGMPRLYREAPLNSIWEGSGNVTALDVLRALARTPGCADALLAELDLAAGGDRRLDAALGQLRAAAGRAGDGDQPGGAVPGPAAGRADRRRHAGRAAGAAPPGPVADAFCGSRLGPAAAGGPGAPFGTLPDGLDVAAIIDRARVSARG